MGVSEKFEVFYRACLTKTQKKKKKQKPAHTTNNNGGRHETTAANHNDPLGRRGSLMQKRTQKPPQNPKSASKKKPAKPNNQNSGSLLPAGAGLYFQQRRQIASCHQEKAGRAMGGGVRFNRGGGLALLGLLFIGANLPRPLQNKR